MSKNWSKLCKHLRDLAKIGQKSDEKNRLFWGFSGISLHRLKIGIYKGARFLILRTQRTLSFYQLFHIGRVGWARDPETWPFFLHFLTFIARYKKRSIFVCNQMFSTNNSENNFSQSEYSLPHRIFYSIQVICSYRTVKSKISWKDSIPLKLPQIWFQGTQISLVYSKYEFGGQVVALDFGDKNADFCLYRTFLDPSLSDILILFFEEDSEYIYRFLISRQKNSLKISRSGT